MNVQINKEALPGLRAGKRFEQWSYLKWRDKSPWKITTRFSTDGEGGEKKFDIKISSSENVGIFFAQYL